MATKHLIPVALDSNCIILIETLVIGGEEEVASRLFDFDSMIHAVEQIGRKLSSIVNVEGPNKTTVEFSLRATMKAGQLVAALVDGEGEATFRITLEWSADTHGQE